MPVNINDRPIDVVREEVIDQLIMNYSHGELSYEAFERRLDTAMEAQNNQELEQLTADLTLAVDKEYVDSKKQELVFPRQGEHCEELEYMVNVFSGSNRSGVWQLPKELRSITVFGGGDIDLSDAVFNQSIHRIKLVSIFGGNKIYIPEGINVISKAFCIFGGVDNSAPSQGSLGAPTVIIEGVVIFSGVNIELKRTLKEKFLDFAEQLKKMFV
jgi:hypothetical protein